MKKILMLTTSEIYHDSRILNEAETLAGRYSLKILARKYPGQKQNPKMPFEIKHVAYRKFSSFKINILSSFLSLTKAVFRENPDIYHAHDLDGLLCVFPAALIRRKILVYDSHELWSATYPFAILRGIQWLLGPLERFLMTKVKSGITIDQSIANILQKKYKKNFLAIHNYPSFSQSSPASFSLQKKFPGKKIILHLGSVDEGRGHEQIIQAAKFLPANMVIVFLGRGHLQKQFEDQANELGLKGRTYFLPPVPPTEVTAISREVDLGLVLHQKISLSYYHALPNKLFQYMAAKVPVLGSNFPELKKIILKNKIGEVVDPANPQLIAQKIIKMTQKKWQKIFRRNLKALAKDKYSWDYQGQKLIKFYQDLID